MPLYIYPFLYLKSSTPYHHLSKLRSLMAIKSMLPFKKVLDDLYRYDNDVVRIVNEESLLANMLCKESLEGFELTFAEQILLFEGSQLGRADCEIPPYVLYENLLDIDDKTNYVRSEVMEWALSINVSKSLFRSGSLTVSGVDFITNSDANNKKYRIDNEKLFVNNDRFSLDLSSRDITIDLQFENCNFYSGINISNSYCESFVFRSCRFGCAIDNADRTPFSVLSKNTSFKGEFIIEKPVGLMSTMIENKKMEILNSNADFSFSKIEGLLKIEGYEANNENELRTKLNSSIINGYLNLYNFRGDNINIINSTISGELELSLARFNNLFADSCIINSLKAVSVECENVMLGGGSLIKEGVLFYKSIIHSDFYCNTSYFGPTREGATKGISVSIGGSTISRAYFSDGFISIGWIDMRNAIIERSLHLDSAYIIGYKENGVRTAINASSINVKGKVSFNLSPFSEEFRRRGKDRIYLTDDIAVLLRSTEYNDAAMVHDYLSNSPYLEFLVKPHLKMMKHFADYEMCMARILGEVIFEHAIIDGTMDCAGAIFKNDSAVSRKNNYLPTLNLRFCEIKGSLFINSGHPEYNAPFIAEGDVDLQNTNINNLFIAVPKQSGDSAMWRLRMIGAKYNYIENDTAFDDVPKWKRLIYTFIGDPFYRAKWIYFERSENNFKQPFEQFAWALFKLGEDGRARDVLVRHRPYTNILDNIFLPFIRMVYILGSRIYLSLSSLIAIAIYGAYQFGKIKYFCTGIKISKIESFKISLNKLIPLIEVGKKDEDFLCASLPVWYQVYYVLHQIMGIVLITMLLVNIARMRKSDS